MPRLKSLIINGVVTVFTVLGTLGLAQLALADSSVIFGGGSGSDVVNPTDATTPVGDVYSSPQFCMPESNSQCINAKDANPNTGTKIQTWAHSVVGNDGNHFEAVMDGTVSDTWPFLNTNIDKSYHGFAVVNLEYWDPITDAPSGLCVSTLNATEHNGSNSTYWSPVELEPCSHIGGSDTENTFIVWDKTGSEGNRMESVDLTNFAGRPEHIDCLTSPNPGVPCGNGSTVVYSPISGAPKIAHFSTAQ